MLLGGLSERPDAAAEVVLFLQDAL
ncbi:uncharacterized protein METZ01_LOCUS142872, partial [marine metagenome]